MPAGIARLRLRRGVPLQQSVKSRLQRLIAEWFLIGYAYNMFVTDSPRDDRDGQSARGERTMPAITTKSERVSLRIDAESKRALQRAASYGPGPGELMLPDAIKRVVRASDPLAVHALVVDAKNERAKAFYERYGFVAFVDTSNRLYLPLDAVLKTRAAGRATGSELRHRGLIALADRALRARVG
jgi:hypothetical protein